MSPTPPTRAAGVALNDPPSGGSGAAPAREAGQTNDVARCVERLERLLYTHQIQLARGGAGADLRRAIDLLKAAIEVTS